MPRQSRHIRPGLFYHVLNRSAGRTALFRKAADFAAFLRIVGEAQERFPLRLVDWCVMSNHWHFVVLPRTKRDTTDFFRWLTHTHAMRWRVAHQTVGYGHLYQGRFKAFACEEGNALRTVRRYVQRNALTAGLVKRAEDWPYSSLHARLTGPPELAALLTPEAPRLMRGWTAFVNDAVSRKELARLRESAQRGKPFGSEAWTRRMAKELHVEHTLRGKGRPKKEVGGEKELRPL